MSYEVDVRHVGNESKSGDAIALRYGDFSHPSRQVVVVIDGGFTDNGADLVRHIRQFYNTDYVDMVVSTHPDNDHVCGLRTIIEELRVGHLLMHRPWARAEAARQILRSARISPPDSLTYAQRSLKVASELEELATSKGIPISEPFAGTSIDGGFVRVIGPTEEFYNSMLGQFGQSASLGSSLSSLFQRALRKIMETWDQDALVEPETNAVSAINNSSVILHADFGESSFLFCADAGVHGLISAATFAHSQGIDLGTTKYVQLPHHGSKRNVGPSWLDYVIGPKVPQGTSPFKQAFISAAKKGAPKHPSKRVMNAATRRGANVYVTQGTSHVYHSNDVPTRPGWSNLTPQPFHDSHDEEDD